jgi:hypothetical protein
MCIKEARIYHKILVAQTFDNNVIRYDLSTDKVHFSTLKDCGFDYSKTGRKQSLLILSIKIFYVQ